MSQALLDAVSKLDSRFSAVEEKMASLEKAAATPASKASATPGKLFATTPRDPDVDPKHGFRTPREFLLKVMEAEPYLPGTAQGSYEGIDPRLKSLHFSKKMWGGELRTKTAGSDEGMFASDPYGGFLVPIGFMSQVLMVEPEPDPIGAATRKIPMDKPDVRIPARVDKNHTSSVSGGLRFYRREETQAVTASRIEYEQIQMRAHSLMGLSYATEEILQDSPQAFASLVATGFSQQYTAHMIRERLRGTGVGEFEGILNCACLVTVDAESGQSADTIVYDNVLKMRQRCWGYSKAMWLANHDTMVHLMKLSQTVGVGGVVVWQPSAREDHPDTLLGRPLYFSEYASTLGNVGDLILGNWNEYLEGTLEPMQSAESIHVRFLNHERAFKFWTRNDGRPWWRSALTPEQSTQTLSPFVVLAAR